MKFTTLSALVLILASPAIAQDVAADVQATAKADGQVAQDIDMDAAEEDIAEAITDVEAAMADVEQEMDVAATKETVVTANGTAVEVENNVDVDIPDGVSIPASQTVVMSNGNTVEIKTVEENIKIIETVDAEHDTQQDTAVTIIRKRIEVSHDGEKSVSTSTQTLNAEQAEALTNSETHVWVDKSGATTDLSQKTKVMVKVEQDRAGGAGLVDIQASGANVTETVTPDGTTRMIRIEPTDGSESTLITITRN